MLCLRAQMMFFLFSASSLMNSTTFGGCSHVAPAKYTIILGIIGYQMQLHKSEASSTLNLVPDLEEE